jgi:hypothetical protein
MAAFMLFALVPYGYFFIREPIRPDRTGEDPPCPDDGSAAEKTLRQAIRTPVFLLFGASCLMTGTANSGIALFNESVFKDRGLSRDVFFDSLMIAAVAAVAFKIVGGALCQWWSMGKMSAFSMLLSGACYAVVPHIYTADEAYAWSIVKTLALSVHTVIYFAIWSYAFGRKDIAQIQGAAHVLTITASGLGPPLFGWCRDAFGSYDPCMYASAIGTLVIGVAMLFVRVPCAEKPRDETPSETTP